MRILCVAEETLLKPFLERIRAKKPQLQIIGLDPAVACGPSIPAEAEECDVLVADPDSIPTLAQRLPNLKWVHSTWAGVNTLFIPTPKFSETPSWHLTRTAGFFGHLISEFVIGHVIGWERKFFNFYEDQKESKWLGWRWPYYRPLSDLTIGILGVGEIGKEVARVCKAHNMTVWGLVSRAENVGSCPHVDQYKLFDDLPELLSESDFVCSILPNTASTTGLLGGDTLKHCSKKKSVFINVGRGNVLHNTEILHAIHNDWISGAILDVVESEPLLPDSPLWAEPKVIINPHVSAISLPNETADCFIRNVERYEKDEDLLYEVDWKRQY